MYTNWGRSKQAPLYVTCPYLSVCPLACYPVYLLTRGRFQNGASFFILTCMLSDHPSCKRAWIESNMEWSPPYSVYMHVVVESDPFGSGRLSIGFKYRRIETRLAIYSLPGSGEPRKLHALHTYAHVLNIRYNKNFE